jgi:threonine/homoserine/homoserine lactone efflux protein
VSVELAIAFWAVSALFIITPGADWAYAMTAGLQHRSVLPAVGGLLAGHLAATLAVTAGVAALLAQSPLVVATLTACGALYLIHLGAGTLRQPVGAPAGHQRTGTTQMRQALKGFGVAGLNPKVFLLFLALMPQFADPASPWPLPVQLATLGFVHLATCTVVYFAVGCGARRVLRARPAAARTMTRLSGSAMLVLGVVLLAEQLAH